MKKLVKTEAADLRKLEVADDLQKLAWRVTALRQEAAQIGAAGEVLKRQIADCEARIAKLEQHSACRRPRLH